MPSQDIATKTARGKIFALGEVTASPAFIRTPHKGRRRGEGERERHGVANISSKNLGEGRVRESERSVGRRVGQLVSAARTARRGGGFFG